MTANQDKPIIEQVSGDAGLVSNGGETEDIYLTISGSTGPLEDLTLRDSGNVVSHFQSNSQGKWLRADTMALGYHSITLTNSLVGRIAGTAVSDPWEFTIRGDSVRPIITRVEDTRGVFIENGGVTQETVVILHGSANETTLEVFDNNEAVRIVQVIHPNYWSGILSELAEGRHKVVVKNMLDKQMSEPWSFNVGTAIPVKIISVQDSQGNEVDNGGITDDRDFSITGSANSNAALLLYDGDEFLAEFQAGEMGDWQTPQGGLLPGMHSLKVAEVMSHIESEPWIFTITSAGMRPVITQVQDLSGDPVDNGGSTRDTVVTIFGTSDEPMIEILDKRLSWGTAQVDGNNAWNKRLAGLEVGVHEFTAKNRIDGQSSDVWSFTVESTEVAPDITRVQGPDGDDIDDGGITEHTSISLSGSAEANSTVEILDEVTSWGTTQVTLNSTWTKSLAGLAFGLHRFRARAISSQLESAPWEFTVAPEEPLVIDTTPMRLNGFTISMGWPRTDNDSPGNTQVRRPVGGSGAYSYSSSNAAIATVDSDGKVRGVGWGEAVITVSDQKPNAVSFTVIVTNVYVLVHSPLTYTHARAVELYEALGSRYAVYDQHAQDELVRLYKKPFPYLVNHYWCAVRSGCGSGLALSFIYPQQELGCADPNLEYEVLLLVESEAVHKPDVMFF